MTLKAKFQQQGKNVNIRVSLEGNFGKLISGRFFANKPVIISDITKVVSSAITGKNSSIKTLGINFSPDSGIINGMTGSGKELPTLSKNSLIIKKRRRKHKSYFEYINDEPMGYNKRNRFGNNIKARPKFLYETGKHLVNNPIKAVRDNFNGINVMRFGFTDKTAEPLTKKLNTKYKIIGITQHALDTIAKIITKGSL